MLNIYHMAQRQMIDCSAPERPWTETAEKVWESTKLFPISNQITSASLELGALYRLQATKVSLDSRFGLIFNVNAYSWFWRKFIQSRASFNEPSKGVMEGIVESYHEQESSKSNQ